MNGFDTNESLGTPAYMPPEFFNDVNIKISVFFVKISNLPEFRVNPITFNLEYTIMQLLMYGVSV
jgi:hypothetical protein